MFWMFSKSFLLTIVFHGYVSWGGSETPPACQYEVKGLDDSVTVNTTMDIGATVYNLTLEPATNIPDPPTSDAYDIILNTNSPYYEMIFVDDHHEVVVKSCLEAGHTDFLYFSINETLDTDGSCYKSMLRIYAVPSNPTFNIPLAVNISVDTCVPPTTLDVIQLQFDNGGNCSSWNCSLNSTNDAKLFWVGTGNTVQTFSNDTNFNFTYQLLVTCFDNDVPEVLEDSKEMDTSGFEALDVVFIDPGPCTSTGLSVTTSLLNITHQDSLNGCSDDPANVALVASLGGVTAGLAAGAGLSILAIRHCRPKRITTVVE